MFAEITENECINECVKAPSHNRRAINLRWVCNTSDSQSTLSTLSI